MTDKITIHPLINSPTKVSATYCDTYWSADGFAGSNQIHVGSGLAGEIEFAKNHSQRHNGDGSQVEIYTSENVPDKH